MFGGPYIDLESVRAALDGMLYMSSPAPASSLEWLVLVNQLLSDPAFPSMSQSRTFAVQHILSSLIRREFGRHCTNSGIQPIDLAGAQTSTLEFIQRITQTQNLELLAWGILYYRFVRVDLNFDYQELATAINLDERTLRRYQKHGLRRLVAALGEAEWEVRHRLKRLRLLALLPGLARASIIGRDHEFQEVRLVLESGSPRHMQITGAAGSGKSIFVEEAVKRQIVAGEIDQLVWIDHPSSPEAALNNLVENLWREDSRLDLKAYTAEFRLVVVLDHLEWGDDINPHLLLAELSRAAVFLVSRKYHPTWIDCRHIVMGNLDEDEVIQLARTVVGSTDFDADEGRIVWETVGGNPLAVKLAVNHLKLSDWFMSGAEILIDLLNQTYAEVGEAGRQCWLTLALFSERGARLDTLMSIWPDQYEAVSALQRWHVADYDPKTQLCCLSATSRRYIRERFAHDSEAQDQVMQLLNTLDDGDTRSRFEAVEPILGSGWPPIDADRYTRWVAQHVGEGLRQGRFAKWLSILENYEQRGGAAPPLDVMLAYAICLRHLANWPQAEQQFIQVLERAGSTGKFIDQGQALLELGVLLRMRGRYEQAQRMLNRAFQAKDHHLRERIQLEQAQIAVDRNDGSAALALLSHQPDTSRTCALRAEANLLLGETKRAFVHVQRAVALADANRRTLGRLYVLVGRLYEAEADFDSAQNFLAQAVTILEQEDDFAGLARARANLGSIFIHQRRYREASDLLTRAESMLLWLGDRAALFAVRHNLNILRARFAG